MGADEGNPTSTGPEAADVPRPVRDMDAADVAAPAEPNDEQMVITEAIVEAQDTTHPENEQVLPAADAGEEANATAGVIQEKEVQNETAVQPASDQQKADQIDEEGAKEDAAQHAGADSIDQPLEAAIGAVEFAKAADSQRVVWARVKGFPHWPAQVLTEKEAAVRMEHVFRPSPLSVPVMFFGTLEIAWIAPVEVVSWADGVKAKYLKKNKTRRKFLKSVEEVHEFLAPGPKRRKAPEGWWKKAINPPKPKPKETVLEIGALGSSTQAAKPGASKGAKGGSKVANGLGVHTNSKVAKRVQRPTKRIDGADEDELKALLGDEAEADATAVPKRRGSAGRRPDHPAPKPPHYEALRRNLWTSRPRPKRLPKDDIPVCGCAPPAAAAAPQPPLSLSAAPPIVPPPQSQPSDAAPADAAVPASVPAELAAAASGPPGDAVAQPQPAGPEDADAPMTARAPQSLGNDVAAPGRAENTLAAEAHAPIAVPGPSAVLVPPAAVANAAKAAMPERIGCGENCLNRLSYIHCDPKQCPCGEHCSNRPFHLLPVPKTELFLTDNRGWGVKAAAQIPRGTFIVEYAGEVIEDHECRRRMAQAKENGQQHFYMMELAPGLIIDARNKGNMARFINSSCSPNCESQKWHDAATGEIRIGIFAADDIEPGTELAYDYQFQHAGLAQDAGAYRCMCGAPNCRGTMDTQPERFKDFGKRVEVFWDGDSVYYRGTVTAYSTTSGKHTILYDDNDIERVDLKMVRHRWLDESAPMKLSPLHAALVAQSGILGPEPLDLNDGPDMPLPQAALPKEAQLEIVAPASALPPAEEVAAQLQATKPAAQAPAVHPTEEAAAQLQPAEAATRAFAAAPAEEEGVHAVATPVPNKEPASVPAVAVAAQTRPVRKSRGIKRKQADEADEEELAQLDRMEEEGPAAQDARVPKQKMLMKRCQRESQEQGALLPGPSGLQAQQAPLATSWATPDPAGAAQLTANFGAPLVPPQLQLPAPFNAPPFAMPPHTLPQMPAGLPGQNSLQVAMYQMLLMTNPQLMQAHKAVGGTMPQPQMPMASLQQMFATFANAAAATSAPAHLAPWPPGGGAASQMLPPMAPLQLGPLTPAGAASGPGQPPSLPMTPNFWGVVPPGYAPQMPPAWPQANNAAGPAAAPMQQSTAVAPSSVSLPAQLANSAPDQIEAAVLALRAADGSSALAARPEAPAERSGVDGAAQADTVMVQDAEQNAPEPAALTPAAEEQHNPSEGAALEEADGPAFAPVQLSPPDEKIAEAAAPLSAQEPDGATDKECPLDSSEPPASQAVETAADTAPSPLQGTAPKEKLPKQTEPEEDASADSHAVPMAVNNCAAAPLEADNGSALPSAEPDTEQTAIATSEAPAVEETAGASAATPTAAADLPQDSLPVAHADEKVQPGPDSQSQLAADAGAALIGSVREEATGTPGKGASEQSKEQSQLATDAGAALLGDVQHATAVSDEPPRVPTQDADTPSPPSEPQNTVPAQQSAGEQQPSTAAAEAEQSGEQPVFQPAMGVTPAPWRAKSQQRLFDPTAALTNGYVSPASGAAKLSLQGLIDPMVTSAAVGPGAAAAGPAVPPAEDVDAEVDEAELWGSLLVDSPSPCKAPKPAWAQDPSLWRANGPGPAPPPLGQ